MTIEKSLDQQHRLYAIREHLRLSVRPGDPDFESCVTAACLAKVAPTIETHAHLPGEQIIAAIGQSVGVKFEEVRNVQDIARLEEHYVKGEKELGFALLSDELKDPTVDALLFQRMTAKSGKPSWVAVLNLQQTESRAYWSRPHEIIHRLAEPPQGRLPLFRHRFKHVDPVERLVDTAAAEIAFPKAILSVLMRDAARNPLTWETVKSIHRIFAPTASLLSVAKACMRHSRIPCYLITAESRGRRGNFNKDVALRISISGYSQSVAENRITFFDNMRVPTSSPMFEVHEVGGQSSGVENLGSWRTSTGDGLPSRSALTSAIALGSHVYGLINPIS